MSVSDVPSPAHGLAAQVARFGLIGIASTITHVVLALLLHAWLGLTPLAANFFAFLAAFAVSYLGNFHFTFAHQSDHGTALWRFLSVSLAGLGLNQTIIWAFVERAGWPFAWGLALVVATVPVATFIGARSFAFVRNEAHGYAGSVFVIALAFTIAVAWHLSVTINHDVAWILTGTGMLLDGGAFGRDVVDVNPPLPWWGAMPVVGLARLTGLDVTLLFKLSVAGLIVLAHMLAALVIRRGRWTLAALCVVPLLAAGYGFGQREHLMLIGVLPFTLLAAQRARGLNVPLKVAVAIGALGAFGFLMKPVFLAVPAGLALWVAWRHRSFKAALLPEYWCLAALSLAFVAAVFVFAPVWLNDTIPKLLATYGAYGTDPLMALRNAAEALWPAAVALVMLARIARPGIRVQAFLVAAAGASLAMLVQGKGWNYHLIAANGLLCMAALVWLLRARATTLAMRGILLTLVVLSLARPTIGHVVNAFDGAENEATVRALIERIAPEDRVLGFSTSPRLVHPAVLHSGARWIRPEGTLQFIPAGLDAHAPEAAREAALQQGRAVVDTLLADPPDVLLVDVAPYKLALGGRQVDWIDWFARTFPRDFSRAMAAYDDGERVGEMMLYRLR